MVWGSPHAKIGIKCYIRRIDGIDIIIIIEDIPSLIFIDIVTNRAPQVLYWSEYFLHEFLTFV